MRYKEGNNAGGWDEMGSVTKIEKLNGMEHLFHI
jgi:hypothetical protein